MAEKLITRRQLVRLQTLWSLLAKHEGFDVKDRALRLAWVNRNVLTISKEIEGYERSLNSFKELSETEAGRAIDKIQECLPAEMIHRRGRKGRRGKPAPLASSAQLARIAELQAALGMTAERFDAWLRSRSSPLRGRSQVRTTFDAGAVIRALENMLARSSRSVERAAVQSPAEVSA